MISQTRLRELLHYEPQTGAFTWKHTSRRRIAGKEAGWINAKGYRQIEIDGVAYKAHRLAWLFVYGTWPRGEIDHLNRTKDDNRVDNLRDVSRPQNIRNQAPRAGSTTGVPGVVWRERLNKWVVEIGIGPRANRWRKHLGTFETLFDAVAARRSAENRYWADSSETVFK